MNMTAFHQGDSVFTAGCDCNVGQTEVRTRKKMKNKDEKKKKEKYPHRPAKFCEATAFHTSCLEDF